MSSDPAHSLADALDRPLGPEPTAVADNLWAQEVDLYYSMQKYWSSMRDLMLSVFKWQGVDKIAAEEMAALPGMGEASALLWLDQFYRSGDYDLIVLDSAPTGETLTLLTLPQVAQWWVSKAFPFQKTAFKLGGLAVRKTTGIPLDRGYAELDRLFGVLGEVQKVLQDPSVASTRLVMNPERMVIQEARRAAGLDISDRIRVRIEVPAARREWADRHAQLIAGEVLATDFAVVEALAPEDGDPVELAEGVRMTLARI